MRKLLTLACLFFCITVSVKAVESKTESTSSLPSVRSIANDDFCFISGTPPSDIKFSPIRKMKLGKGSYGGVRDILDKFASQAKSLGADAIINYTGSQRFGFWPWRVVRPVVRGTAIKWENSKKPDCKTIGGATLKEILNTNKAPEK